MRNWEKTLSVLEALRERGQAAGHGWTLDTELLLPHQLQVNALEKQGLGPVSSRDQSAGFVLAAGLGAVDLLV
ncbi:hypothetical protein OHB25_59225 [Streptomyces mirabilis]|uniref:hypothetical protein n=1 Tax=Streptomyces mirabilis TaxID=68239 RepID=UPI002E238BB9